MLIILFGLSGSGKNFVAEILARRFNYYFWDADNELTDDMCYAIQNKESFTQAMRDNFTNIIIKKISELQKKHENLVITQAFYKRKNRGQISKAYPDAKLVYIQADQSQIISRLQKRNNLMDVEYAKKISLNFEEPDASNEVIKNNDEGEDAVIRQLEYFIKCVFATKNKPQMG